MKYYILLLSAILTTSFATFAQEDIDYPASEWDHAKAMLMHTQYPFYEYDLLGMQKVTYVPKIFIDATD